MKDMQIVSDMTDKAGLSLPLTGRDQGSRERSTPRQSRRTRRTDR